jgi:hypothetical protein
MRRPLLAGRQRAYKIPDVIQAAAGIARIMDDDPLDAAADDPA